MNERLVVISGELGQVGQTLGAAEPVCKMPVGATLVYAWMKSSVDDAGLTGTVKVGSAAKTTDLDLSATATAGVWKSKHFGGTADPTTVAADDAVIIVFANAAADTRVSYALWFLVGEK